MGQGQTYTHVHANPRINEGKAPKRGLDVKMIRDGRTVNSSLEEAGCSLQDIGRGRGIEDRDK